MLLSIHGRWSVNGGGAHDLPTVGCSPGKPGLKREGGCRRDGIAASRRDLYGTIARTGSESDGLAPPSKIAEGMGRVSTRKGRDFSPMSSAPTSTTEQRLAERSCVQGLRGYE